MVQVHFTLKGKGGHMGVSCCQLSPIFTANAESNDESCSPGVTPTLNQSPFTSASAHGLATASRLLPSPRPHPSSKAALVRSLFQPHHTSPLARLPAYHQATGMPGKASSQVLLHLPCTPPALQFLPQTHSQWRGGGPQLMLQHQAAAECLAQYQ